MKKLNLVLALVVLVTLLLTLIPGVAWALVSPVRDLPATASIGTNITVTVTWTAANDDFNSILLTDSFPVGWTASAVKAWCTPAADQKNIVGSQVEYIWNGPYSTGQAFTAIYHVLVPAGTTPGTYDFSGNLSYYIAGAGPTLENLAGDTSLDVVLVPTLPTVVTNAATAVGYTTVTLNGNITASGNVTSTTRGFQYGKVPGALNLDTHEHGSYTTGAFSLGVISLDAGDTYYFRAYSSEITVGTAYGSELNFATTSYTAPSLTIDAASAISYTTATLNGNITGINGINATIRGFEYDTNQGAPYAFSTHEDGSYGVGAYSLGVTSLTNNTKYYFRAYATNTGGTGYSAEGNFTTSAYVAPTVVTNAATVINYLSATLNGNITSIGTHNATVRGFQFGKISGALNLDWHETGDYATGAFNRPTGDILDASTLYYFRAYATNLGGTSYGSEGNFTTLVPPSVTTNVATNITLVSATLNGSLTALGSASNVGCLFQWGPVGYGNTTVPDTLFAPALFSSNITGLTPGYTYHFRTEAIGNGTVYGSDRSFTTLNTATGLNVTVSLPPVTLTFGNATATGLTTLDSSGTGGACGALDAGYYAVGSYYDVSTTATYVGTINIAVSYTTTGNETLLRLFHCEGGIWVDRTTSIDTGGDIIYGQVSTLSPFVIGTTEAPIIPGAPSGLSLMTALLPVIFGVIIVVFSVAALGSGGSLGVAGIVMLAIGIVVGLAGVIAIIGSL